MVFRHCSPIKKKGALLYSAPLPRATKPTLCILGALVFSLATPAFAGPPFLTDDPAPTDPGHYEIYVFATGAKARDGSSGDVGVDFSYGAAPDLQLTATIPYSYDNPQDAKLSSGFGNIELAAKYRFLHQDTVGWDVAVFPRVFIPSGSDFSDDHASLLIPIWVGKNWDRWSSFGGGGCALHQGGDAKNYCQAGWALTRQMTPNVRLGGELFHQSADVVDGKASTSVGLGATYDVNTNLHFLAYAGAGLQNTAEAGRGSWYTSVLFTF